MRTLILASLLVPALAHADDAGVVVTGEATLQPQLVAELESWLKLHGRTPVVSPLEPDAINTLIDCFVIDDQSCARNLVEKRAKTNALVFARADVTPNPRDGSRDVTITGFWFQKGHDLLSEKRTCARCTEQSLRTTADELMQALAYHVTVTQDQLPTAPPPAPEPPPKPEAVMARSEPAHDERSRLLPLTLVGAGGVALVSAGILLAIDQKPSPTGLQQPTYRDTATGGIVLGIAGIAAVGAGVYLWLHQDAGSAPVAAIVPGGGYAGWAGRF